MLLPLLDVKLLKMAECKLLAVRLAKECSVSATGLPISFTHLLCFVNELDILLVDNTFCYVEDDSGCVPCVFLFVSVFFLYYYVYSCIVFV